jgi:hypothetical protein
VSLEGMVEGTVEVAPYSAGFKAGVSQVVVGNGISNHRAIGELCGQECEEGWMYVERLHIPGSNV